MTHPSGLRIVAVHTLANGATGPADEWVAISNDGPHRYEEHEWELCVEHERPDSDLVFPFPLVLPGDAGWWTFEPGEVIFVFTGRGRDVFVENPTGGRRPQFQLHWGRHEVAWDRPGRQICVRQAGGGELVTDPFPLPAHPRPAAATGEPRTG